MDARQVYLERHTALHSCMMNDDFHALGVSHIESKMVQICNTAIHWEIILCTFCPT